MLRQIAKLGRSVPAAGERAIAIAVYADALDDPIRAQEAGYEGVACVDDAARALDLYCDLWEATLLPWTMRWCVGLLDFILAMQDPDGRWLNFISDWDGTPNRTGRTSVAGGAFWQARALLSLSRAGAVCSDERIPMALHRGMRHAVSATHVPSDVRALHVMTALRLLDGPDGGQWLSPLATWSAEIMGCSSGDVLMNSPDERGRPHLWGHIQEGVLADAGVRLGRDELISAACRSADRLFPDIISGGFDLARVQPYDVSSAVHSLTRLAEITGRDGYANLAREAREWFEGRNPSGQPVYDRAAGRVADGVDGARVNTHSGAEANIVGAQAMFEEATALARSLNAADALPAFLAH